MSGCCFVFFLCFFQIINCWFGGPVVWDSNRAQKTTGPRPRIYRQLIDRGFCGHGDMFLWFDFNLVRGQIVFFSWETMVNPQENLQQNT